jgi:S-adenosylmethionine decarboxylase
MQGIHLIGDCYDCAAETEVFCQAGRLRDVCVSLAAESGLTVLGESFHQFEPRGVTGVVLLAESHLAVHTWPEHGFATLDVYACNHTENNMPKAEALFDRLRATLAPRRMVSRRIERGDDE